MNIRLETQKDYRVVDELTREAFKEKCVTESQREFSVIASMMY